MDGSATLFAARHYGGVEALAKTGGHFVDLLVLIDLNGLAGCAERDFAVLAAAQMFLQVSTHVGSYRVVDQIVKHCQKLCAGHFSTPISLDPFFLRK